MKDFVQIQALWQQQANPGVAPTANALLAKANQSHRTMRAEHMGTLLILSATLLALVGYFWLYNTTASPPALQGSGLMVLSLLLRIGVEYGSYRLFTRINPSTDLRTCLARTRRFCQLRRGIQWVITPLSLGSYVGGFILLLPYIRAGVSEAFYWYILVSGLVFVFVISMVIYRQVRREQHLLAQLEFSYAALLTE